MSIKVMLADDHVLCREGIKQLLEFDGKIEVICEVSDGEECLVQLNNIEAEVLILDINLPKKNGFEVLKELRKKNNLIKVLMLTVHNEVDYMVKAINLGANGYLAKDSELEELKKAIDYIVKGEKYIQTKLIPAYNNRLMTLNSDKEKINLLTKRELEILIKIANGMFNREIAMNLSISERTVKNHISNIFKKLEVNDRTQAAVFAIKNDIVKL